MNILATYARSGGHYFPKLTFKPSGEIRIDRSVPLASPATAIKYAQIWRNNLQQK